MTMVDDLGEHEILPKELMRRRPNPKPLVLARGAIAARSAIVGAFALGAMAVGAVAIGAMAIGALRIGRLGIGRVRLGDVEIDDLVVHRLRVLDPG
jgi:hypothetical protein